MLLLAPSSAAQAPPEPDEEVRVAEALAMAQRYVELGEEQFRRKKYAEAVESFLEAERCYDLGMAWRHKGEGDYARDYFERAQRAAPESRWAARAGRHLDGPRQAAVLAEFL